MNAIGLLTIGEKGLIALEHLNVQDSSLLKQIQFVVVGEDSNVDNDYSAEIRSFCRENKIETYSRKEFANLSPDFDWLIAIGWKWLLDINKWKVIVLHDSLLPRYRGFNPLVTALIEGDEKIGVTAIEATEEVDQGPIISQKMINVEYPIKIKQAIEKVAKLYGEIVLDLLSGDLRNHPRISQDEGQATYSLWRNHEDYVIDWTESADRILRFIDAVGSPYLGACTSYDGKIIRVLEASYEGEIKIVNRKPGKIFSIKENIPVVVCGKGLISIERAINEEGKLVKFRKLRVRLQ